MFIKIEPAEFFMYRVIMIFDLDKPDSEDQDARDYLYEHELESKCQRIGEFEGSNSEFMQFGGCYLGKHLGQISQIQRTHVETEILTDEIQRLLQHTGYSVTIPEGLREEAMKGLAQAFHQGSSFQTAENGELKAVLDGDAVREAALAFLAGSAQS